MSFAEEKSCPKIWADFVIYKNTSQSKQSPKRREFARSGHPENADSVRKEVTYVI
jgi:hypothetical protein